MSDDDTLFNFHFNRQITFTLNGEVSLEHVVKRHIVQLLLCLAQSTLVSCTTFTIILGAIGHTGIGVSGITSADFFGFIFEPLSYLKIEPEFQS